MMRNKTARQLLLLLSVSWATVACQNSAGPLSTQQPPATRYTRSGWLRLQAGGVVLVRLDDEVTGAMELSFFRDGATPAVVASDRLAVRAIDPALSSWEMRRVEGASHVFVGRPKDAEFLVHMNAAAYVLEAVRIEDLEIKDLTFSFRANPFELLPSQERVAEFRERAFADGFPPAYREMNRQPPAHHISP